METSTLAFSGFRPLGTGLAAAAVPRFAAVSADRADFPSVQGNERNPLSFQVAGVRTLVPNVPVGEAQEGETPSPLPERSVLEVTFKVTDPTFQVKPGQFFGSFSGNGSFVATLQNLMTSTAINKHSFFWVSRVQREGNKAEGPVTQFSILVKQKPKLDPSGEVFNKLPQHAKMFGLKPGDTVAFFGPIGNLLTPPADPDANAVYLATGIDVGPCLGMVEERLRKPGRGVTWLFLGGDNLADLAYHNEFVALQQQHPQRFKYYVGLKDQEPDIPQDQRTFVFPKMWNVNVLEKIPAVRKVLLQALVGEGATAPYIYISGKEDLDRSFSSALGAAAQKEKLNTNAILEKMEQLRQSGHYRTVTPGKIEKALRTAGLTHLIPEQGIESAQVIGEDLEHPEPPKFNLVATWFRRQGRWLSRQWRGFLQTVMGWWDSLFQRFFKGNRS